jgi:hypothetical protein
MRLPLKNFVSFLRVPWSTDVDDVNGVSGVSGGGMAAAPERGEIGGGMPLHAGVRGEIGGGELLEMRGDTGGGALSDRGDRTGTLTLLRKSADTSGDIPPSIDNSPVSQFSQSSQSSQSLSRERQHTHHRTTQRHTSAL